MTTSDDFDHSSPLKGTNLIEASAGTGKTYAITGLFLRLILEKNLSANQILVVTFTEAATGELKDRIRTRLREAIAAFSTESRKDKFLNSLIENNSDHASALKSLKEAVRTFDEACIYTIHGFCRKVLRSGPRSRKRVLVRALVSWSDPSSTTPNACAATRPSTRP